MFIITIFCNVVVIVVFFIRSCTSFILSLRTGSWILTIVAVIDDLSLIRLGIIISIVVYLSLVCLRVNVSVVVGLSLVCQRVNVSVIVGLSLICLRVNVSISLRLPFMPSELVSDVAVWQIVDRALRAEELLSGPLLSSVREIVGE